MTKLVAARGPHGTVICGQPACRRELPGIWRMEPGDMHPVPAVFHLRSHIEQQDQGEEQDQGERPGGQGQGSLPDGPRRALRGWDDRPFLFMAWGWHQDEAGVWRVTQRGPRRHAFLSGRVQDLRRHRQKATYASEEIVRSSVKGQQARKLPSVAVCPFCGTPQWLDPKVLGVDPLTGHVGGLIPSFVRPEDRQA